MVALRKAFPNHPIVADLKTMDAGYLEAEMMFKAAGSSFTDAANGWRHVRLRLRLYPCARHHEQRNKSRDEHIAAESVT